MCYVIMVVASQFKEEFEKCQKLLRDDSTKGIVDKLEKLVVHEDTPTNGTEEGGASESTADQSNEPADNDTPTDTKADTVQETNTA